ncbi:ABC transporter substrate-binding protein [Streptomyces sp. NPDC048639]|uniref:ABC transporter substrate-binding protein n=1 Tax=Streptomyces sp. NPDC048639 TaxID=3365581 RepID=UPI00370FE0C1
MRRRTLMLGRAALAGLTAFAGLAACAKVNDTGGEDGAIKVGVLLDVTGPGATLGVQEKNGIRIAVDEINKAGGIDGRKVETVFADSQSKPDIAAQQARRLIDDGAQTIIGTSLASTCMAVRPLAEARKVTQYCMSGADVPLGERVFGASFDPSFYLGELPARWMKDKGFTKAACIATSDKSGEDYDRLFRRGAKANKVGVVATETFAPGDTNVDTQITNIAAERPEVLYGCVTGANIAPVVKAVKAQGLKAPVWAGTGATSLATAELVKSDLPPGGVYSMGTWIQVPDEIPDDLPIGTGIRKFARTYEERHNARPDWPAAAGYDAAKLIAGAYEKGARDGAQVAEKLQAVTHHRGLLSDYSFSAKDHRGTTPPEIVLRFTEKGRFTVAGKVEVDR